MTQQLSSQVSSSPARNAETVVEKPVLDNQTNTLLALQQQQSSAGTSLSLESIYSCLDCGEEFFYCEPLACDTCGGIEFEEVSA